jgi:YcaO-like protein with predicted kinase domain
MTWQALLPGLCEPVRKGYRAGTDRVVDPDDTLARARPHLAEMGITRIANVTGLDQLGIPVVMVCRPNSRALAVAQGKGLTLAAAKASGLMESVEAYHAERITLPLKLGSYAELRASHRLVDVAHLNRPRDSAFHPDLPLLWIEGFDVLQQQHVWLPYEMVHCNFTTPRPTGSGCFSQTSNGLASGNHVLEALTHGIDEVIERDAATLWALLDDDAQLSTLVDLDTVDDPDCRVVLETLERAGMSVTAWEMTSDVGVPSYLCMFSDPSEAALGYPSNYRGYGCHATHRIALLRALTEAVQMRLTIISGSRDDLDPVHYRGKLQAVEPPAIDEQEPLVPQRRFAETPECDADTFDEEMAWKIEQLAGLGIERVVVIELTKPHIGLPVVRVVIPGLELAFMDWNYFALGARGRRLRAVR